MKLGAKRKKVKTIKLFIMMIIFLFVYISLTVHLLFYEFDDKHLKIFRLLGKVMGITITLFILFILMSSVIARFVDNLEVNYTILLFILLFTFLIIFWAIKVKKFFE
jgi:hypothetical protein